MNMPVVPACPPAELEARLRLHQLPEVGPRRFHALIDAFGDAASALTAPPALGVRWACRRPVPRPVAAPKFVTALPPQWPG